MAGLGTEVGDAFIDVHADTTSFRRELRTAARAAAQDFGKRFGTNLDKAIDGQLTPLGVRVRGALTEAGRLSGAGFADAVEDEVISLAKRIDGLLVSAIVSGDFKPFVDEIGDVERATKALDKRLGELRAAQEITLGNSNRIVRSFFRWKKTTEELTDAHAKQVAEQKRKEIQDKANLILSRAFNAEYKKLTATSDKLNKSLTERPVPDLGTEISELKRLQLQQKLNAVATTKFEKEVKKLSGTIGDLDNKLKDLDSKPAIDLTGELKQLKEFTEASESATKRVGDGFELSLIGRLKGSRNNFLNIVGTIGEFLERLSSRAIIGGLDKVGTAVASLGTRLLQTGGPLSGFGVLLGMVGERIQGLSAGGLDGLLIQIGAMSLAFQASAALAGPLVAGLSLLAGAATSLTVSLGGALLGGLTLLGPLLASAAVGAAALALAFSDLDDAQKAVFDPLKDLFNETRDAVQGALFQDMGSQIERVVGILSPFKDVLVDVANATREWFSRTLEAFDPSGPLGASLATLGQTLPGIFTGILDLLTNLGTSLTGLFAAASPSAQIFLDKINGVVARFSEWVNSAEGQATINEFLTTAQSLMNQVWLIAQELGKTLGILFESGEASGSTFLQMIKNILADFNTWLGTEEGRAALSQWFTDSVEAIQNVGAVLGSLIALFDSLDNEDTRNAFNLILASFTAIIDIINFVIATNSAFISFLLHGNSRAVQSVDTIKDAVNRVLGSFSALGVQVQVIFGHVANVVSGFASLVRDKFAQFAQGAKDKLGEIISTIRSLPGLISVAFGFAGGILRRAGEEIIDGLRSGISGAVQGLLNYIAGVAGRISSAFKKALGIKSPSKVFAEHGRDIGAGLALGITQSQGLVDSALNGLIDSSKLSNLNSPVSSLATQGATDASGVSAGAGTVLEAGAITVVTPYADPRLVAVEVMDALAVRGK